MAIFDVGNLADMLGGSVVAVGKLVYPLGLFRHLKLLIAAGEVLGLRRHYCPLCYRLDCCQSISSLDWSHVFWASFFSLNIACIAHHLMSLSMCRQPVFIISMAHTVASHI